MKRRVKQAEIAAKLLIDLLTVGDVTDAAIRLRCVEGLPNGAVLVDAKHNGWTDTLKLLFEHPEFDEVPLNEHVPSIYCQFTKTDLRAVESLKQLETA